MKQVLVTGGTSGIGKGIAEYFAKRGDSVVIVGTRDNGSSVAEELGVNVSYAKVDVSQEDQVRELFAKMEDESLDVLVNAAGIYVGNDAKGIVNTAAGDFEWEWRVNTLGTFMMCKYALPLLKEAKGNIVNVTSISGMQADAFSLGYTASKAATNMLTKSLALAHVADGVRVNAVCPGPIDTPMLNASFGGQLEGNPDYEAWIADNPMKRYGTVADVVRAVAYLADPANTYVTGTLLTVDGGWTARAL